MGPFKLSVNLQQEPLPYQEDKAVEFAQRCVGAGAYLFATAMKQSEKNVLFLSFTSILATTVHS